MKNQNTHSRGDLLLDIATTLTDPGLMAYERKTRVATACLSDLNPLAAALAVCESGDEEWIHQVIHYVQIHLEHKK